MPHCKAHELERNAPETAVLKDNEGLQGVTEFRTVETRILKSCRRLARSGRIQFGSRIFFDFFRQNGRWHE